MTELVQPVKRVEQYLYALCVMDFNNIPIPRSRLEFFVHALITGVLPEFQAETREEVYITAIITGDYANLPLPKSRADQLLYKICLGETEIRDIELETRYEMLLAYIAEHGYMPLETVLVECVNALQTIPNTVEVPVKSAILKGNTLVNLLNKLTINAEAEQTKNWYPTTYATGTVKSGKYILLYNVKETTETSRNTPRIRLADDTYLCHGYDDFNTTTGIKKWIFTANADLLEFSYWITYNTGKVVVEDFILLEYQDGMENWDIPYFEGMQSVKMPVLKVTGKNLFDAELERGSLNSNTGSHITTNSAIRTKDFVELSPNKTFSLSKTLGTKTATILIYNNDKKFVRSTWNQTFTLNENERYIKITDGENNLENLYQLEEGSNITPFERFKSNILTVNEEVELRGIGDVQDTLDCLTGEMTQRIDKVVWDGSDDELWSYNGDYDLFVCQSLTRQNDIYLSTNIIEKVTWNGGNHFALNPSKYGFTSHKEGIEYLKNNPITIQYKLATESVKTVDLTIQDQDGNAVPCLSTFNDATHVSINAVDIIPQVDLEVHVDANTMANVASQQDDLVIAQANLSDAIDAQNDDIEMTKQALDEVKGE